MAPFSFQTENEGKKFHGSVKAMKVPECSLTSEADHSLQLARELYHVGLPSTRQ